MKNPLKPISALLHLDNFSIIVPSLIHIIGYNKAMAKELTSITKSKVKND